MRPSGPTIPTPDDRGLRVGVEDGDDSVSGLDTACGMPWPVGRPRLQDADDRVLPGSPLDDMNPCDACCSPRTPIVPEGSDRRSSPPPEKTRLMTSLGRGTAAVDLRVRIRLVGPKLAEDHAGRAAFERPQCPLAGVALGESPLEVLLTGPSWIVWVMAMRWMAALR